MGGDRAYEGPQIVLPDVVSKVGNLTLLSS